MSIDSKYFPQVKATDDDTVYTFEFETSEPAVVEVYLVRADGVRVLVPQDVVVEGSVTQAEVEASANG